MKLKKKANPAVLTMFAVLFMLMISCTKDEKLIPEEPVRIDQLSNVSVTNLESSDPVSASVFDIRLGNEDYLYADIGVYYNLINGESLSTSSYFGKLEISKSLQDT